MKLITLLIAGFTYLTVNGETVPRVTTNYGTVEGFIEATVYGKKFFAFEGIPYAKPPVGKHRFKEAIPPRPWTGIWQAKTMFKCMQYNLQFIPDGQDMVEGDEDCLYINLYTPNLKPKKKMDVLVFIHDGGFMFNYGGAHGPQLILERDVVFINFNYRLGPLGFMSTEDEELPGNDGLKDQILALRWVKENVQYFGGNANSITISGSGAGAASVQFHYLMPQSKGLFHRGISQSGTVLNCWVLMENPFEKTKKVCATVGCPTSDSKRMVDCLRRKPARQIVHAVKKFQPWLSNPFSPFGVVVDSWALDPVLPKHPYLLLKSKQVNDLPWITSYTTSEGLYPAAEFYYDEHFTYLNKHWSHIWPYIMHYNEVVDSNLIPDVNYQLREYFFDSEPLKEETYPNFVRMLSERLFVYDIEKASRLHAAAVTSPVYSYAFDYRGALSKSEYLADTNVDMGVSHGDDTCYVIRTGINTITTKEDREMNALMINMFTTFMKTGEPNITATWVPLSKNISAPWNQIRIAAPHTVYIEQVYELTEREFWDNLPLKENEHLFTQRDEL